MRLFKTVVVFFVTVKYKSVIKLNLRGLPVPAIKIYLHNYVNSNDYTSALK